jgi:hypothetical protein
VEEFGVRFAVSDVTRFAVLRRIFEEAKKDKEAGTFRNALAWAELVPDEVKSRFSWLTPEEREAWATRRGSTVIAVPNPEEQLGGLWVFDRVFEAIEESEYSLLSCEIVGDGVAEMQINPDAYPYGGVGPFIALAEAFGFRVLGVNEYGKYQTREELMRERAG